MNNTLEDKAKQNNNQMNNESLIRRMWLSTEKFDKWVIVSAILIGILFYALSLFMENKAASAVTLLFETIELVAALIGAVFAT